MLIVSVYVLIIKNAVRINIFQKNQFGLRKTTTRQIRFLAISPLSPIVIRDLSGPKKYKKNIL